MDTQSRITEFWNAAAANYDERPSHSFQTEEQEAAWKAVLKTLLPLPPAHIMDVGTGTGVIAVALAELGYKVLGIDTAEAMLARGRSKVGEHDLRFALGDAMNPPGSPQTFDVIISRHVLWTLTNPRQAFGSWLRLLKPGGRIVAIDGLYGERPDRRLGDLVAALPLLDVTVTLDDIRNLVEAAGFADVQLSSLSQVDAIESRLMGREITPRYALTATRV